MAYELVAMYKLGANASMMTRAFELHQTSVAPAMASVHYINASNWQEHIGAWDRGKTDNSSVHYADYVGFFREQIQEQGMQSTVAYALPHMIDGLGGDLFHAVIQMGYCYESLDAEVCAEGLAWMATGYQAFPPLSAAARYVDIRQAMADLHADDRLPSIVTVKDLQEKYAYVMADYDLSIDDQPDQAVVHRVMQDISLAVLDFFAVDGYRSFFILHLCTGSRAVQIILAQLDTDPVSQAVAVRRLWNVVLYYFVEFGRPLLRTSDVNETLPSWEDLAAETIPFLDEHLSKMVYLARENDILWDIPRYQLMADRVVKRFQAGQDWDFSSRVGPPPHSTPASDVTVGGMLPLFLGIAAALLLLGSFVAAARCRALILRIRRADDLTTSLQRNG